MPAAHIRLLVSVRDANEAMVAIRGGADIVDVKEPIHGSLGRASAATLDSIRRRLSAETASDTEHSFPEGVCLPRRFSLSVALGEVTEWVSRGDELQKSYATAVENLKPTFLKVGMSALVNLQTDWRESWKGVRSLFAQAHQWVAVAYADFNRAESPRPEEILEAALSAGCRVLLIDTFEKDGSTLLDWLMLDRLRTLRNECDIAGLQLALAGRVTQRELPQLRHIGPDIIAVRGAVCSDGQRTSSVDLQRVKAFATALQ